MKKSRMTLREILNEFDQKKSHKAEAYVVNSHGEAQRKQREEVRHFSAGTLNWKSGDKFNYRLFAGLLLIDKDAAKAYYFTTS